MPQPFRRRGRCVAVFILRRDTHKQANVVVMPAVYYLYVKQEYIDTVFRHLLSHAMHLYTLLPSEYAILMCCLF